MIRTQGEGEEEEWKQVEVVEEEWKQEEVWKQGYYGVHMGLRLRPKNLPWAWRVWQRFSTPDFVRLGK
jgi:hypothetical protein